MVRRIVGVGERDGVTAVDQNREQSGEPVDRAFHGEQLGTPVQFDTMHVAVPVRGGLQERRLTIERRVSRVERVVDRRFGDVADEFGRVCVGVALRQVDHVGAGRHGCGDLHVHVGEHVRRDDLGDRREPGLPYAIAGVVVLCGAHCGIAPLGWGLYRNGKRGDMWQGPPSGVTRHLPPAGGGMPSPRWRRTVGVADFGRSEEEANLSAAAAWRAGCRSAG